MIQEKKKEVKIYCDPRYNTCKKEVKKEEPWNYWRYPDIPYDCDISKGKRHPFSIFNIKNPIGEIIYESNSMDERLEKINETPEYICFVN